MLGDRVFSTGVHALENVDKLSFHNKQIMDRGPKNIRKWLGKHSGH